MAEFAQDLVKQDQTLDDEEYNPAVEPREARAWLNLLEESRKAFKDWNDRCDNLERLYANMDKLNAKNREKEFQIFWANCEVMRPSIYAKPPIPVVVPKFKDRRPLYQTASEVLERTTQVTFDLTRLHDTMYQIRDDLALVGRGVAWCRYESGKGKKYGHGYGGSNEKVCVEFKHRRDFLHSVSRNWYEVTWVAAASYLTRAQARKRFRKTSGDEYQNADYEVQRNDKEVGGGDKRERAQFWEVWRRGEERVVWVAEGCDKILDEDEPHLSLTNFFPCPRPVYATCQPGSLMPVPDMMFYKDQLDEINLLTARIHALSDAVEVKGFYPAGARNLRRGRDRNSAQEQQPHPGAHFELGRVRRVEGNHRLVADDGDCQHHHRAGGAAQTGHRGHLSNHWARRYYERRHRRPGDARRPATQDPVRQREDTR